MAVKTKRKYILQGNLTNSAWLEANHSVGAIFDHLTQVYSLVYEGMAPVNPEFTDFSLEHMEMLISEENKEYLTAALIETKRRVDNYMFKAGFPCVMEFAGGISPRSASHS
ncbi:MAG: hypothetical protein PQJ60_12030 [Spirochaetales bacterium]|nr:hypothetical protein [Spirochaetales bacterium]